MVCLYCNSNFCDGECEESLKAKGLGRDKILSGDLLIKVRETLSSAVGLTEEQIDTEIIRIQDRIRGGLQTLIAESVKDLVAESYQEELRTKVDEEVKKILVRAVSDEMVILDRSNGNSVITTAKKYFMDKTKEELRGLTRNNKTSLKESLEYFIRRYLDDQIDTAINEMKEECVEKFNKAAMKKMMTGMAKAIGEDKKLLALLTD